MKKTTTKNCKNCQASLTSARNIYCNNICQKTFELKLRKQMVLTEDNSLSQMSYNTFRKYLLEARGAICDICKITSWCGKPLVFVLDHIDGNSENSKLTNLRFVCSNCDSQLPTYKNRNKHNGRHYRRQRYRNNQSY
jgi:hypothetical protein